MLLNRSIRWFMGREELHPWSLSLTEFSGDFYFRFSLHLAIAFVRRVGSHPLCGSLLEHKSSLNSRLLLCIPKRCRCFWWTTSFSRTNMRQRRNNTNSDKTTIAVWSQQLLPRRISSHSLSLSLACHVAPANFPHHAPHRDSRREEEN